MKQELHAIMHHAAMSPMKDRSIGSIFGNCGLLRMRSDEAATVTKRAV